MSEKETKPAFNYDEFPETEATPSGDLLARISRKAADLMKKKKAAAKLEADLKRAEQEVTTIEEVELPNLMIEARQKELTTSDDLRLEMEHQIFTNVSKERKGPAIEWLDANGQGGMVKRHVIIQFNKCDAEKVERLLKLIGKGWPNHSVDLDINAATIKSFVKGRLKDGLPVPLDIFGVHERDVVHVTEGK